LDYFTKTTVHNYSGGIPTPNADKFVNQLVGYDAEMFNYFQKVLGFYLTGEHTKSSLFLLGAGSNGKSKWRVLIEKLLQGFFCKIRSDILIAKESFKSSRQTTEVLCRECPDWEGCRLGVVDEVDKNGQLMGCNFKSLTEGTKINGREYHKKSRDIDLSTMKLLFCMNDAPAVSDEENFRSRIKQYTMESKFILPDHQQYHLVDNRKIFKANENIDQMFVDNLGEFFAFAVEGSVAFYRDGLETPDIIKKQTDEFFMENDPIIDMMLNSGRFEQSILGNDTVPLSILCFTYNQISGENIKPKQMKKELVSRGGVYNQFSRLSGGVSLKNWKMVISTDEDDMEMALYD